MEQKEWYKNWFNTKYYHFLYQHRDEKEAEKFILNVVKEIGLSKNAVVWDNACGKGRHVQFLSRYVGKIIGTDICESNINLAKNFYSNKKTYFYVHDMRKEFYINYFDVVFNLFTSIGYFDYDYEEMKSIKIMIDALKKGGFILIDFFNPDIVIKQIVPHETKNINGVIFNIFKELKNNAILKKIHVLDNEKEFYFLEKVKLLPKDFFIKEFEKNNVKLMKIWGDYDLNPFNRDISERMIFMGVKE